MKMYLVGGAVRDQLMGIEAKDRDWVVVGANIAMLQKWRFTQVGKDFPTFLHPYTREEYSLARREREGGVAVFDETVTIEEDLAKRDLTINAIAYSVETGEYIDPFNGRADIENKVLRMVSEESFIEDPLRVFRVARFMARYPDFTLDKATMLCMWKMAVHNKIADIPPERVWKEISRGLMEIKPSRMINTLKQCLALKGYLPELDALYGVPQPEKHHPEVDTGKHIELAIDYAAEMGYDLETRYAVLMHDLGKGVTPFEAWPKHHGHEEAGVPLVKAISQRLRVPNECEELAVMASREHLIIHTSLDLRVRTVVATLERCDAYRRSKRFEKLLNVAMCDARGRASETVSFKDRPYPQLDYCLRALAAAKTVVPGIIAMQLGAKSKGALDVAKLKERVHAARVSAVKKSNREYKEAQLEQTT